MNSVRLRLVDCILEKAKKQKTEKLEHVPKIGITPQQIILHILSNINWLQVEVYFKCGINMSVDTRVPGRGSHTSTYS